MGDDEVDAVEHHYCAGCEAQHRTGQCDGVVAAAVGAVAAAVAVRGTLGVVVIGLVALAVAVAVYAVSRRAPVTANNVNDLPPPRVQTQTLGATG